VKALEAVGAPFGDPKFSNLLEGALESGPTVRWQSLCKAGYATIWNAYKASGKRYRAKTGKELTLANFSKTQEYVGKFIIEPTPQTMRRVASPLLK